MDLNPSTAQSGHDRFQPRVQTQSELGTEHDLDRDGSVLAGRYHLQSLK